MRPLLLVLTILPMLVRPLAAQDVQAGASERITIRGFIAAAGFVQDANFGSGNGTRAEFVRQELDGWWHGGDARNTRITLEVTGPKLSDAWRSSGTFELDFFGGFAGAGAFGDEQPLPRLRLAFADLGNGRTRVRFGQQWSLTLGEIPTSVAHLGFPLGWGSGGFIGWRFVGLSLQHGVTRTDARTHVDLQAAVLHNSWSDETDPETASAGEAGWPQLEGRVDFSGEKWRLYLVGHWDRKDLAGVRPDDDDPAATARDLDSWAAEAGGRVSAGALTIAANGYVGRAMGHHFAHIVQFDDIRGWGAWAQLGFALTDRWSIWGYGGTDRPDEADVRALGDGARLHAWLLVPMLRWQSGPVSASVEWLHATTRSVSDGTATDRIGNQLALALRLDF